MTKQTYENHQMVDLFDESEIHWTFWQKDDSVKEELSSRLEWAKRKDQLWDDLAIVWTLATHNAILRNPPRSGGTEAQDWGAMLLRMYTVLEMPTVKLKSWTIRLEMRLESSSDPILWRATCMAFWNLEWAFTAWFGSSPFDSAKRRHTSLHCWGHAPELDDTIEVEVRDDDIKMDTFRLWWSWTKRQQVSLLTGGALDPHSDRDCSGVHRIGPNTGNRDRAMKMLQAKLYHQEREWKSSRSGFLCEITWGSQIRSYSFYPLYHGCWPPDQLRSSAGGQGEMEDIRCLDRCLP